MEDSAQELSARDVRARFSDVLHAAIEGRATYITYRGKRAAMVAPLPDLEHELRRLRCQERLSDALDTIRGMVGLAEGAPEGEVVATVRRLVTRKEGQEP